MHSKVVYEVSPAPQGDDILEKDATVRTVRVRSQVIPLTKAIRPVEVSKGGATDSVKGEGPEDKEDPSYKPIHSENPTATREEIKAKETLFAFTESRRGRNGSTGYNGAYLKGVMAQVVQGSSKVKTAAYAVMVISNKLSKDKKSKITSWTVFFCQRADFDYFDFVREMSIASQNASEEISVEVNVAKITGEHTLVEPLSFVEFCGSIGTTIPTCFSWEGPQEDLLFSLPTTSIETLPGEEVVQEGSLDQDTETQPTTLLGKFWKFLGA